MRKIAILNQKGGVGKTTTAVNLAAALAKLGKKVCLLDLDPQAHASTHLGIHKTQGSIYEVLVQSKPLQQCRVEVDEGFWLVPSEIDLAAAEVELAGVVGRELLLRDALAADSMLFDFCIMDCPPSLGILTLNALACVQDIFIPLQPHFFALHGLSKLLETTGLVSRRLNADLTVAGIILTLYENNTRLTQEVVADLNQFLENSRGVKSPWQKARLFSTRIRKNIKLAECPSHGKSIFSYDPKCHGAVDYTELAREILNIPMHGHASQGYHWPEGSFVEPQATLAPELPAKAVASQS
ncbi:MAG: ParA family protein [Gemmataceae bacterium]|nr:ParA family protein [Gemmataceae bacterium]